MPLIASEQRSPLPVEKPSATIASRQLWVADSVCGFFGGEKPIDHSTLYRGIETGRYPRPINISDNAVRWFADECEAALEAMIAKRDAGERTARRNGGRRRAT